jgi:3-isopropylmalate/(R)-2-methylmalate dehydratase large subunit
VEKILGQGAGAIVEPEIDVLMAHDGTASLIIDAFRQRGARVHAPERVLIVFDHFAPPATVERANIQNKLLRFAEEHRLPYLLYRGICHQLLAEDPRVVPGRVVVGADSHTVTAGALGCFATGVGSTDFLTALTTGRLWFRVPGTIAVRLRGTLPPYIQGKDVILALAQQLGDDGACYKCLEFHDETENGLSMDGRLTLSNMSVDLGAKAGIFVPDAITEAHVRAKGGEWNPVLPDTTASYERTLELDLSRLEPLVALPHGLDRIRPARELHHVKVSQVFIGSCTGGRLEDLARAAQVFERHPIHPPVKTIVIPASNTVAQQAMAKGYVQVCMAAGAAVANSSCGPCAGIDKGIMGEGEACVSTSSRNFQGRMGSLGSDVYLGSALTAAASAARGHITDPREVLS